MLYEAASSMHFACNPYDLCVRLVWGLRRGQPSQSPAAHASAPPQGYDKRHNCPRAPGRFPLLGANRAPKERPYIILNKARAHRMTQLLIFLQGFCWDALNVPADLLLHRPLSTDAGKACTDASTRCHSHGA